MQKPDDLVRLLCVVERPEWGGPLLDFFHVHCVHALWSFFQFICHRIAFPQWLAHTCLVHEDLFSALIGDDETVAFFRIEEFHFACRHHY